MINNCKKMTVPKDVCYLRLSEKPGEYRNSADMGVTDRGERVFMDYDVDGKVIGIELVSDDKPCQRVGE